MGKAVSWGGRMRCSVFGSGQMDGCMTCSPATLQGMAATSGCCTRCNLSAAPNGRLENAGAWGSRPHIPLSGFVEGLVLRRCPITVCILWAGGRPYLTVTLDETPQFFFKQSLD